MKHKILFLYTIMVAIIITAVVLFEESNLISEALGIWRHYIDGASVVIAGTSIIPQTIINQIKHESR